MTPTHSVQLIGLGRINAIPAGDLVLGDTTVWNYGYRETVVAIEPKGAQSLIVSLEAKDGKVWQRTMRKTRLVAIARPVA